MRTGDWEAELHAPDYALASSVCRAWGVLTCIVSVGESPFISFVAPSIPKETEHHWMMRGLVERSVFSGSVRFEEVVLQSWGWMRHDLECGSEEQTTETPTPRVSADA